MTPEELKAFLGEMGEPAYRAGQIFSWLHRGVFSFDDMTDLPKGLRASLAQKAFVTCPAVKKKQVSLIDGTIKYLYGLSDGEAVESVVMGYNYGDSICISTQAGCAMNCAFCASAIGGFRRNLTPSEMLDQILYSRKDSGRNITHCVLMGIGEPLNNFDNVVRFLKILSLPGGVNMSMRHVSLSTCGVVDRIYDLMKLHLQITLSVSLHAPFDELRSKLMPVNRRWGLDELMKACRDYTEATGRRISFEYAMLGGVNDTPACARELGRRLRGMLCHVNLIPVNPVKEKAFSKSPDGSVQTFQKLLTECGLNVTVRRTLGADISASCGQLRHESGGNKEGTSFVDGGEN